MITSQHDQRYSYAEVQAAHARTFDRLGDGGVSNLSDVCRRCGYPQDAHLWVCECGRSLRFVADSVGLAEHVCVELKPAPASLCCPPVGFQPTAGDDRTRWISMSARTSVVLTVRIYSECNDVRVWLMGHGASGLDDVRGSGNGQIRRALVGVPVKQPSRTQTQALPVPKMHAFLCVHCGERVQASGGCTSAEAQPPPWAHFHERGPRP